MPITVNELTTEIIAEPAQQLGGAPPSADTAKDLTSARAELAAVARLDLRIRAESFDD
jgi:hypothetical protein